MWLCFRLHILCSTRLCSRYQIYGLKRTEWNIPLLKQMGAKSSREHSSTSFFFFVELAVIQVFHTIASCVEILTGPSAAQLTVTLCIELN